MKTALRETQTLRAGCSNGESKFLSRHRPLPGAQDDQNLISWRWSVPSPTDPGTQLGEDQCTQFRVIVVTDPHTNKPTDRTDYNTLHC